MIKSATAPTIVVSVGGAKDMGKNRLSLNNRWLQRSDRRSRRREIASAHDEIMAGQRGKALTQLMITRMHNDNKLLSVDKSTWYCVQLSSLPDELRRRFVQLHLDGDTQTFIDESTKVADSFCLQLWYNVMSIMLGLCLTKTSINGLLNRGQMFVFSKSQLEIFLGSAFTHAGTEVSSRCLLDLGAGDGAVTSVLAQFFRGKTYVTEASLPMQYRLKLRGYSVVDIDKWESLAPSCGLIAALNLLDRHPEPRAFLSQLHRAAIQNNTAVLLAFVLPFSQFSEFSSDGVRDVIRLRGRTFEAQLHEINEELLRPAGFELHRWTKLPYLCQGDATQAYYVLTDALLLLRPVPIPVAGPESGACTNEKNDEQCYR